MATRAIKRKALFMCSTSLAALCNDIYSGAENLSPSQFQGGYPINYSLILESPLNTGRFRELIPDRPCPRCWKWTGGRPWGGSAQLWGYHCQCGWQRVITSPAIKAAKERVREAQLTRVGGAR
jgi:hypothetical protein